MTLSHSTEKPFAKDLSYLLSTEARSRNESPLKSAFKYYSQPDLVFLGGGLPLATYFPFNKVVAETALPPFQNGIGYVPTTKAETNVVKIEKRLDPNSDVKDIPLARSLQYGFTEGQPELVAFLKEHTQLVTNIPYQDWTLMANTGSTQAWDNVLRNFCNKGDSVLVEEFTFSSALEAANAQSLHTIPVKMDGFGIIPEELAKLLDSWNPDTPKPKLIYIIPTGQNPTGSSLSYERRKEIYKIIQKHDLILIEDEPYYFLQMDVYTRDLQKREQQRNMTVSHEEFINSLIPTFLSLDVDGRVIRFDSASKTLAPGSRLGWFIGQKRLLERFIRIQEVSAQAPCGFTSSIINGTLQRWGQKGFLDWLIGIRKVYSHNRNVTIDALNDYMPLEVVDFIPPIAGMFFTFNIDATKHPKFASEFNSEPLKVENAIYERALKQGCLMIPGSWFVSKGNTSPPQRYILDNDVQNPKIFFRGTYAAVPMDELVKGIKRFAEAIKLEFEL
ncbi:bifunctional 2-aminoadipate transaminase/aromatic-amino-acid:2-oxoglutarate transaminase [Ascoidea rubescens DSM 1968]|uniref:aromatic-amino-acid transaminase n=1 Tax=Ascoidea rubescens DSM 1968 TaxID=1344418 RepID=A0A1D2VLA7_9ASCO|nr:aromatic amino acid aminotransferase [Ascoidea rubescens DSM 1968]ODV62396.1 aromatic amino acid aminotransferase [Ascoidea rubescens DSM 1968]